MSGNNTDCINRCNTQSELFIWHYIVQLDLFCDSSVLEGKSAGIAMKPSKNDETDLDSEAARRALDYYLNPNPPRPTLDNRIWTLHEGVTGDQAQEHAIALLRCAAATAQETATHQHGSQRELTFALMHMMDMARALLEHKRTE
ncbi:hypothetical protein YSA_08660 [Pseudomonas putida ND6]|jgi:hypothetical protein|uniref:DUF3077 domain-containing protein n=11 Tax=Pseudomonas TaxID=286 RepID=I3V131_PSEPU|nr:hypothetical protein YSA_08660 [Pseudomonas putida ND6]